MDIVLSSTSNKPIYQQLFEQISAQIIKRELERGASLPPIRTVAKELRISVITVKKAWEELERKGLINTMTGKGCFVAQLAPDELEVKRDELALERLKKDISYLKRLGYSLGKVIELLKRYYDS
jgi:GntR family transcriptional regulator